MEEENKEAAAPEANATATENKPESADSATAAAGKEAAKEMKAEAERAMNEIKNAGLAGFLGFNTLYFPIIAKVLWIILIVLAILGMLVMIVASFFQSILDGIFSIVLVPLFGCFMLLQMRVWFEFMVVAFRINDGIQQMNEKMK